MSVGFVAPERLTRLSVGLATHAWLEVGAEVALGTFEQDLGQGRTLSTRTRAATLFARWLPLPALTPYLLVEAAVVSEANRGDGGGGLGWGRSLSYERAGVFGQGRVGIGLALRRGSGLTLSGGAGLRMRFGGPDRPTVVTDAGASDEEVVASIRAFNVAVSETHGVQGFVELSLGVAF